MRITVKVGIICAATWMLFKVLYHVILPDTTYLTPSIFINMFLLMLAVSIGLYLHKRKEGASEGNALSDIKAAMTSGIPYAVLVSLFIYLYYAQINPDFNRKQIQVAKTGILKAINNPKTLKELKKSQEAYEVMTNEQIYKQMIKGPEGFYKASSTSVISMLSLVLLTTLYSILITVIFRSLLFRRK